MFGVAILYLVAMAYAVWWAAGVRAHRREQVESDLVIADYAERFPGAALEWSPADDERVADYLDAQARG